MARQINDKGEFLPELRRFSVFIQPAQAVISLFPYISPFSTQITLDVTLKCRQREIEGKAKPTIYGYHDSPTATVLCNSHRQRV